MVHINSELCVHACLWIVVCVCSAWLEIQQPNEQVQFEMTAALSASFTQRTAALKEAQCTFISNPIVLKQIQYKMAFCLLL